MATSPTSPRTRAQRIVEEYVDPMSWPEPVPFEVSERPDFPTWVLPEQLRAFVENVSASTQTPPDLAGTLALAAVAAACGGMVDVRVRAGYCEPLNLYTACVLGPGERKTAVRKAVAAPLEAWEAAVRKDQAADIAAGENKHKVLEQRLKKARDTAAAAKPEDLKFALEAVDHAVRELDAFQVPKPTRLLIDDCTPEMVGKLLGEHDRLAILSAEGEIFELMAGRYSQGVPNLGVFLKAHAGDVLITDRVSRPEDRSENPALTIGLAVQPDVVESMSKKPGFRGRGLIARFLYAYPVSLMGMRSTNPPEPNAAACREYEQRVRALLNLRSRVGVDTESRPGLVLDDAAIELYQAFQAAVEPRLGPKGNLHVIRDWGGRLVGAVLRIAGNLHMFQHAYDLTPWDTPITRETLHDAIDIGDYFADHAKIVFSTLGDGGAAVDAKRLLPSVARLYLKKDHHAMKYRDIQQLVKRMFANDTERIKRALAELVERGYIVLCDIPSSGRSPRVPKLYYGNPNADWVALADGKLT